MNSTITASLAKVNSIWLKVTCEIEVSTSTTVTISSTDTVYVNTKRPMTADGIDLFTYICLVIRMFKSQVVADCILLMNMETPKRLSVFNIPEEKF